MTLTTSATADLGQTEFTLSGISPDSFNTNHLPRSTVVVRVVAPPGPPPAPIVVADYTFTCADSTVAAGSTAQFPCVGASRSYTGPLNLKVTAGGPGGPVVTVGSQIAMRPGPPQVVVLSIDATNSAQGSYSYTATARHDAAGPGSNYKFTVVVSPPASD